MSLIHIRLWQVLANVSSSCVYTLQLPTCGIVGASFSHTSVQCRCQCQHHTKHLHTHICPVPVPVPVPHENPAHTQNVGAPVHAAASAAGEPRISSATRRQPFATSDASWCWPEQSISVSAAVSASGPACEHEMYRLATLRREITVAHRVHDAQGIALPLHRTALAALLCMRQGRLHADDARNDRNRGR